MTEEPKKFHTPKWAPEKLCVALRNVYDAGLHEEAVYLRDVFHKYEVLRPSADQSKGREEAYMKVIESMFRMRIKGQG